MIRVWTWRLWTVLWIVQVWRILVWNWWLVEIPAALQTVAGEAAVTAVWTAKRKMRNTIEWRNLRMISWSRFCRMIWLIKAKEKNTRWHDFIALSGSIFARLNFTSSSLRSIQILLIQHSRASLESNTTNPISNSYHLGKIISHHFSTVIYVRLTPHFFLYSSFFMKKNIPAIEKSVFLKNPTKKIQKNI